MLKCVECISAGTFCAAHPGRDSQAVMVWEDNSRNVSFKSGWFSLIFQFSRAIILSFELLLSSAIFSTLIFRHLDKANLGHRLCSAQENLTKEANIFRTRVHIQFIESCPLALGSSTNERPHVLNDCLIIYWFVLRRKKLSSMLLDFQTSLRIKLTWDRLTGENEVHFICQEFHIRESIRVATYMRGSETEKLNEIYMPFGVKERNGGTGLPRKEGSLLVNKKSKYLISRCLPCCIDGITLGK